jgi:hypothetical protein
MVQAAGGRSLPRSALDSSRLPYRSRSACQAASFSGRIRWPSYKVGHAAAEDLVLARPQEHHPQALLPRKDGNG